MGLALFGLSQMVDEFFSSTDSYRVQKSLKRSATFEGIGLHSGAKSKIILHPAPANTGTVFAKAQRKGAPRIPAHYDAVVATSLATTLGSPDYPDFKVSTVEHLMSALYATGITNVLVEVSGPEIPILDGSASPFIEGIMDAGIEFQDYTTPTLKILKPIKVYQTGGICELLPRDRLRLTTSIDFPHPSIGPQTFAVELTPRVFREQISCARTFGFASDLDRLRSHQLALGASLENVLAFSEEGVLNEGGMRFTDECVRHKLLDALGDLALCGCWIEGEMVSFRGGHSIHLAMLKALKAHRSHWEIRFAEPLPGLQARTERVPVAARALTFS